MVFIVHKTFEVGLDQEGSCFREGVRCQCLYHEIIYRPILVMMMSRIIWPQIVRYLLGL